MGFSFFDILTQARLNNLVSRGRPLFFGGRKYEHTLGSLFEFLGLREKEIKGAWRMPWLTQAMKDVISCDKLRVGANDL